MKDYSPRIARDSSGTTERKVRGPKGHYIVFAQESKLRAASPATAQCGTTLLAVQRVQLEFSLQEIQPNLFLGNTLARDNLC
jgi:hypothetical protein